METQHNAWSVVIISTLAFTVYFAIPMMFAVIGAPIKQQLGMNGTRFSILVATPVGRTSAVAAYGSFIAPEVIKGQIKAGIPEMKRTVLPCSTPCAWSSPR